MTAVHRPISTMKISSLMRLPRRRTSLLVNLAETFISRVQIVHLVSSVRLAGIHQDVLRLSDILTNHNSSLPPALLRAGGEDAAGSSALHKSLLLFLVYRSLLALHRPYFISLTETGSKAFSYSQKICVQASLAMLSPITSFLESSQGKYYHLHFKGCKFRDELFHAAATLCFEIRP